MIDLQDPTHEWSVSYPKGKWPVYKCARCSKMKSPTEQEMQLAAAPAWWYEPCPKPRKVGKR